MSQDKERILLVTPVLTDSLQRQHSYGAAGNALIKKRLVHFPLSDTKSTDTAVSTKLEETKAEIKAEIKKELKDEIKEEMKAEILAELKK
ncbi:hypothetical protein IAT40_004538 [Kwoniella sp. CBS 6097]